MDAFFKYIKQPYIKEDFKSTFDLSAKFKYPQPSESQKGKYFEDEFNVIFQKFYQYLRNNNTLPGKTDQEVEHNIKSKVDQSDLVIEFDSWLEQQANQFVILEKPKPQPIQHNNFSNPNPTTVSQVKHPIASTPTNRISEPKINTNNPFHIEKNPPPSPSAKSIPSLNYQPIQAPPPRQAAQSTMQYMPAPPPKIDQKERPFRFRFLQKLSEYMDCPQRMSIIKVQLNNMMKKNLG